MSHPSQLCSQIEQDFPGIWARIDKGQPTAKTLSFPLVTESVSRTYPAGTSHPFGHSLRYLLSSSSSADQREGLQGLAQRGVDPDSVFVAYSADALQSVAAWRTTRLHYEFDEAFYDALAATPMKGTPPAEIFRRLPAKAFFFSRKGGVRLDGGESLSQGFFVVVFDDRLMLMPISQSAVSSGKFILNLNEETVESALDRLLEEGLESSVRVIKAHPRGDEAEKAAAIQKVRDDWPGRDQELRNAWSGALSCLMYLCTEAPDVDNPNVPSPKMTRMGGKIRFLSPKQETAVAVGVRLGAIFRKQAASRSEASETGVPGTSMPAHIRRAHWHTYWVGKRGEQKQDLKWISPILVNAASSDELSETIHPVSN